MAAGLFNGSFTIWRKGRVHNGKGGYTKAYASTGQTVSGRMAAPSAKDMEMAGQSKGRVTHVFACAVGPDIRVDDEIRGGVRNVRVLARRDGSQRRRMQFLCEADTGGDA